MQPGQNAFVPAQTVLNSLRCAVATLLLNENKGKQNNTASTIYIVSIFSGNQNSVTRRNKTCSNINLLFLRPFITPMFHHYELLKAESNKGFNDIMCM